MKRFEDVLRIISSVLLGTLIRDVDNLRRNLEAISCVSASTAYKQILSSTTAVVLICIFIRNIHASVRFDAYTASRHYSPSFEDTYPGRVFAFLLALGALFCGPFLAGRWLAANTQHDMSAGELGVVLFFPFVMYAIWDILLWCSDSERDSGASPRVWEIAHRWVAIDAVGLLLVLGFVAVSLCLRGIHAAEQDYKVPPDLSAIAFIFIASFMVIRDYKANFELYFPCPRRERCETEECGRDSKECFIPAKGK